MDSQKGFGCLPLSVRSLESQQATEDLKLQVRMIAGNSSEFLRGLLL